ncbi:MAG: hypothetical protein P4M11_09955 [Candidatus Pacebacteria bacterium]|nr:hypothetical protein [Candidatus Paceibacterota bacterium]
MPDNINDSLGVDLGNVIIDHLGFGTTTEYFAHGNYNAIPPVPGVFNALKQLSQRRFSGRIFVVYNANDVADQKILSWLKFNNFFGRTGISPDRVKRSPQGRDKSAICELYEATHFVDDRLEVLGYLVGKIKNLYLLRPQIEEVNMFKHFITAVTPIKSWDEALKILLT